ncbi:hypothetical protein LTR22_027829, partial [Elasticomyces elasticus]
FSAIVTIRLIQFSAGSIISSLGEWYVERRCAQINSIWGPKNTLEAYPDCSTFYDGTNPDHRVVVKAGFPNGSPVEISAALGITFGGGAGRLAPWLHAIMIEIYRLRRMSYELQLARGSQRPGYAGLVAERFGDANPYVPTSHSRDLLAAGEVHEMVPGSDK